VEQSFNEQLFARVFDYATLFSHVGVPYHLSPKTYAGERRYDDFSLGSFGAGADVVYASAELKGANITLDSPLVSGKHRGTTPVQQAFGAARYHRG
jgi:hypothetical protein